MCGYFVTELPEVRLTSCAPSKAFQEYYSCTRIYTPPSTIVSRALHSTRCILLLTIYCRGCEIFVGRGVARPPLPSLTDGSRTRASSSGVYLLADSKSTGQSKSRLVGGVEVLSIIRVCVFLFSFMSWCTLLIYFTLAHPSCSSPECLIFFLSRARPSCDHGWNPPESVQV